MDFFMFDSLQIIRAHITTHVSRPSSIGASGWARVAAIFRRINPKILCSGVSNPTVLGNPGRGHCFFQDSHGLGKMGVGDRDRRQEPDDIAVDATGQQDETAL